MPVPVINAYHSINSNPPTHLPLHRCGGQLYLYPISLDEPAQYYECKTCNIKITLQQVQEVFRQIMEQTKTKYNLKILELTDGLVMESSVFVGEHRLEAKRRSIRQSERREIYDYIITGIRVKLGISVDSISSLFKREPEKYYHV